jgi:tetratricopeptide (TPR) repeat protein
VSPSPLRTADVARVLAIPPARVRAMVHAGWCRPGRDGRVFRFEFQDVVLLRTALGLRQAHVPATRVRRALRELLRQLPADRPLSGVRIVAAGGRVVARSGDRVWQPESGQLQFAFTVDELARRAESPRAISPRGKAVVATPPAGRIGHRVVRARHRARGRRRRSGARRLRTRRDDRSRARRRVGQPRSLAHEAGDPAVAARCYHQALMRDETDPVTHFNLALACEDLEKIGEAAAHYRRAVALNPRFADAHFNLAQLLSRLGRRDEAVRHMMRYRQLMRRK